MLCKSQNPLYFLPKSAGMLYKAQNPTYFRPKSAGISPQLGVSHLRISVV